MKVRYFSTDYHYNSTRTFNSFNLLLIQLSDNSSLAALFLFAERHIGVCMDEDDEVRIRLYIMSAMATAIRKFVSEVDHYELLESM